ncbi:hypothetical protein HMPREF3208_01210 [Gardnerella vaginalis]|uniref:Uncharacterized protein n=1 Tax=Gardnerella vaginalis TaxID=2702 RepID=A0A133NS35_GARVA|nr:hypothetical protein HMPREF3208_01210 [Gardnerella vaginalis]
MGVSSLKLGVVALILWVDVKWICLVFRIRMVVTTCLSAAI